MKVAALNIEADTNEFGFTPGDSPDKAMQELTEQKNKFNEISTYVKILLTNTFRRK
ncbi:MAG: hypothetical protein WBZ50_02735 [Nitrososphaeraceae archaeon]